MGRQHSFPRTTVRPMNDQSPSFNHIRVNVKCFLNCLHFFSQGLKYAPNVQICWHLPMAHPISGQLLLNLHCGRTKNVIKETIEIGNFVQIRLEEISNGLLVVWLVRHTTMLTQHVPQEEKHFVNCFRVCRLHLGPKLQVICKFLFAEKNVPFIMLKSLV